MGLILIIIMCILLFGGGGGYYYGRNDNYARFGGPVGFGGGLFGLIVVVLLIAWLAGVVRL